MCWRNWKRPTYVFCLERIISKLPGLIHTHIFHQVLLFSFIRCFTLIYHGILNSDGHKMLVITWILRRWVLVMPLPAVCVYYHSFKQSSQADLRLTRYPSHYLADEFNQWGICVKIQFYVLCWNGFCIFFLFSVYSTREKMTYSVECLRDYV